MTAPRYQHLMPASLVLVLAGVVTWLSFTQEPLEAFLFPRLISVFFIALAVWNFIRAATGIARVGGGLSRKMIFNLLPGMAVMVVYVFWMAPGLGFYTGTTITFLTVYTIYDPALLGDGRAWLRRIIVTAAFMAVIYGLFALLLQVQTPKGLFL